MPSLATRLPSLGKAISALQRTRSSLVGRAALVILLVGFAFGACFILGSVQLLRKYEIQRQLRHTDGIVTTVGTTVRIACFTKDRLLAAEVAQGLMTNEAIAGVRIASGPNVLAEMYRASLPLPETTAPWVRQTVTSPFNPGEAVGEIELFADHALVDKRAKDYAIWLAVALFASALATTIAVALVVFTKVVRPIGILAANLKRLPPRTGGQLPMPNGHEDNEIGQLTRAFNALIAELATLLRQEQSMLKMVAHSERNFRTLAEHSPDCIIRYDRQRRLVYANPLSLQGLGRPSGEGAVAIPEPFSTSPQYAEYLAHLANVIASGVPNDMEIHLIFAKAESRHYHIRFVAERDDQGSIVGALALGRDVTESKRIEQELLRRATHDALTGLPNRILLKDRLTHALAQARRHKRRVAVIFIDLDNFKDINDSLGHEAGDELLKLLAARMRNTLREGDTVARLGGDEFVVLIDDAGNNADLETVMRKLFEELSAPCELNVRRIYPGASLGVAVYPSDGDDAETLMRNADTAMYVAKSEGRRHYRFFSQDMDQDLQSMMDLNSALHQALERREFTLHYQPKVRLADGRMAGMEALIRWRHPERGFVPPAVFIPLAEKNGLIGAIGHWVLDEACRQTREWLDAGLDPGRVAVNLSAAQCQSADLADEVSAVLMARDLPGSRLEVEITESQVMSDGEQSIRTLWGLRELGISLAVDDFGTGYSSLAYLKRLPVNTLKIDKSFIDDLETAPDDLQIVRTIIAMAHGLDLEVVAEGVETAWQRDCLRKAGCDQYQGYYCSRPLPADEIAALLESARADRSPALEEHTGGNA